MAGFSSRRLLGFLMVVAIACLWLVPMPSELWLDETVTRWIVTADLAGLVPRAIEFQWSPLYFLLPWASVRTQIASQEILLRAPSLLAMAIACLGVVRIGHLLWDRETGLLAGLVFVTSEQIAFAAVDARPYAVGIAFAVFSMDRFLLWRETDAIRHEAASILMAALAVYTQPLLALVFVVQGVDLLLGLTRGHVRAGTLLLHATLMVLTLAPMGPVLLRLVAERESLSWAASPAWLDLAGALAPLSLCLTVATGLAIARWCGELTNEWRALRPPGPLATLVVWWLAPILLLFAVSRSSTTQLFVPKYHMLSAPGFALLVAYGVRHGVTARFRAFIAIGIALVLVPHLFSTSHRAEGWREASRVVTRLALPAGTPILIRGGLVESLSPDWLTSAERVQYLLAPLSAYPIEGNVIPLPAHVGTPAARHYMDVSLGRRLAGRDEFVAVSARGFGVDVWLQRWAAQHGFWRERVGLYGILEVSRYRQGAHPG